MVIVFGKGCLRGGERGDIVMIHGPSMIFEEQHHWLGVYIVEGQRYVCLEHRTPLLRMKYVLKQGTVTTRMLEYKLVA